MPNALWMALFASSGFGTFFPVWLCVFRGHATRWCSLPLMSAMVWIGMMILFSLSSDMDEISVELEIIIVSATGWEKSGEFKEERKRWEVRWKAEAFLISWLPKIPAKFLNGYFTISFIFCPVYYSKIISNLPGIADIYANQCCCQLKVCIRGNLALLHTQVILPRLVVRILCLNRWRILTWHLGTQQVTS